jgi:hypothetical protein
VPLRMHNVDLIILMVQSVSEAAISGSRPLNYLVCH